MFERVLVPLDGSEVAAAILPQIRRILLHQDADILLVQGVYVPANATAEAVELPDILVAHARKYLEGVAAPLRTAGARVRTEARIGPAADVILDVAAEEKSTLIAMTTHGRSGLSRWIRGSVAEKVLRESRVPVFALRSYPEPPPVDLRLKRVLVPLDATEASLEIVGPAIEVAALFGASTTLLHVCEGAACSMPVPELTRAYERFRQRGLEVQPVMKMGDAAAEILDSARELRADLIAMTTHGRRGPSRWAFGSVTEKVLRAAETPLLIARPAKG